jgi:lactobin A/cerein 7B family class IIb bacteriocin
MVPAEIVELTDTELDAVSGGFLNLGNVITQVNVAVPIASAFGGGGANSPAVVQQFVGQVNFSA